MSRGKTLDEVARARIISWRKAAGLTGVAFGRKIGRNAVWVTRWERAYFDTDLTTLAKMAAVFGHTLFEVLDVRPDVAERDIIDAYRAIRPAARPLARNLLRALAGKPVR